MLGQTRFVAVSDHERVSAPTYETAHRIVTGDLTAPIEMVGWTVLRSLLIAPALALAGVRGNRLVWASLAGSSMVSLFALWRSYATAKARAQPPVGLPPYGPPFP